MDDNQFSMFGDTDDRMAVPRAPDIAPSPDRVRRRIEGLIDKARGASSMPWSERDLAMWEIVVPQMSRWLPDDEAQQLCFAFAAEVERLRKAA